MMLRALLAVAATLCLALPVHAEDALDAILKRGALIVGVSENAPPFSVLNPKTQTFSGYDVDFAAAIARRLGVKLQARTVDPAERIPKLQAKDVDMVIATFTKNAEREKLVDFSFGYFVTGQKFVVRKGKVNSIDDLTTARVGSVTGTTSAKQVQKEMPRAKLVLFEDYDEAFKALAKGDLDAVTTDEPILAGLLAKMPNRNDFEIPNVTISLEIYGIAVRKGEARLLKEVNDTLIEMERSGEAARIFERWFGANSPAPLNRTFTIRAR